MRNRIAGIDEVTEQQEQEPNDLVPGWRDLRGVRGTMGARQGQTPRTYQHVGNDDIPKSSVLVATDILTEYTTAITVTTAKSGIIMMTRGQEAVGFATSMASVFDVARKLVGQSSASFDTMALGAALYEKTRQRRFKQPGGVPWLVVAKEWFERRFQKVVNNLGYSDIAFGQEAVNRVMGRMNGVIPVAGGGSWDLLGSETVLIGIEESAYQMRSLDMWILSHLDYPLVERTDTFRCRVVGDPEEEFRNITFIESASLVLVPQRKRRIVFVVMNKLRDHLMVGESQVPVLQAYI